MAAYQQPVSTGQALGDPCFICGDSNYEVKIRKVWK